MKKTKTQLYLERAIIVAIVVAIITVMAAIFVPPAIDRLNAPEIYSSTMRADLLRGLESNDPEMLEYYKIAYIDKNIYLFDGPLTFKLMCEKYDLDVKLYTTLYDEAEYTSIQDFYNDIVKDIVNK